jgi:predicted ribosomally synthesized peptide with SipW-like signal peptide
MKKILGLTVSALMVMGLVGGGTWAYFSDTESTSGNVLAAGTLNLEVDSEDTWVTPPINIINIAPGETTANVTIDVANIGNLDGDLYVRINGFTDGGGTNPEPEVTAEAGNPTDNISTMLTLGAYWNGTTAVTNLDGVTIDTADGTWSGNYVDLAGTSGTASLEINATLDTAATNIYQGDNCTFTLEFYLAQNGQGTP